MAKKSEAKRIRELLSESPTLENQEVIELLKDDGVSVTSSQVSAQRKRVEPHVPEEAEEPEPTPPPAIVIGYDAIKLRSQVGCSEEAITKVVEVQQAEGLRTAADALRHILEKL